MSLQSFGGQDAALGVPTLSRAGNLLQRLVAIPSLSGDETEAVEALLETARRDGLRAERDPVGNAIVRAGHGPLHVVFVGHIDTVPGDLPVRIEDGVLWGRGSVDAKAPLVAAYEVARRLQDSNQIRMTVVAAVGEEADSRGCHGLVLDDPDVIIVGEPSHTDGITIGYRGILRGALRVEVPPAHGGHPDPTAAEVMAAHWQRLQETFGTRHAFTRATVRLDRITSDHDGARDVCTAHIQVRLPPGMTPELAEAQLTGLLEGATWQRSDAMPPAQSDPRSPLVAAFRTAIRAHGRSPRLVQKTGTADFNLLSGYGVPMVAYGPGDSDLDHAPDERIALQDLDDAIEILHDAIATWATHA